MKHLRLLSFLLLLILPMAIWAGPRTYKQAQAIAERQAAQMGVAISQQAKARSFSSTASSSSSEAVMTSGLPAYYVFPYGENNGYSIVSGDDLMPELVAYSDKGTMDEANLSDGCREFLLAYKEVAEAVAKGDAEALKLMALKRGLLASAEYQQPKVEPLLGEIAWGQSRPYNGMCPYDSYKGNTCLTGCAATAMAQVMKYWKYPKSLQEDIPGYYSNNKYRIETIAKGETYDWDLMLDHYSFDASTYTQEQADAVAKLMLHCGAAIQMKYSVSTSGGIPLPESFVKYFGYDPDLIRRVFRGSFILSEWCRLIDAEMSAKRPVLYAGFSPLGIGHMFVCDGTDGNGLYHMNWGSEGYGDGYYDITVLAPIDQEEGGSVDPISWNKDIYMLMGIQPDNGVKDEPLVQVPALTVMSKYRDFSITSSERTSASEAFTLSYCSYVKNMQPEKFSGLLCVGLKDKDGNYVPLASKSSCSLPENTLKGYYSDSYSGKIEYAFPIGTTVLYDIYSTDEGGSWQLCSYDEDVSPCVVLATETSLSIVNEKDDFKTTLKADGELVSTQKCNFTYTMTNPNSQEYYGEVDIYTSNSADALPSYPTIYDYVNMAAGGSASHTFTLDLDTSGDLYIWVYDAKHKKMMIEAQKFTVDEYVAPQLKLLSKSINHVKDLYESENAYYWDGERVHMPVVDGDEAIIKYVLQDNAGKYDGNVALTVYAYSKDDYKEFTLGSQKQHIDGNGGILELEFRFKPSDLDGRRSFKCELSFSNYYRFDVDYSDIEDDGIGLVDNPSSYYIIHSDALVGYISDGTTEISTIPTIINGVQISAAEGSLSITAGTAQPIAIYSISGQCVCRIHVQSGTTTVSLPSGIYLIGKQKVLVK